MLTGCWQDRGGTQFHPDPARKIYRLIIEINGK